MYYMYFEAEQPLDPETDPIVLWLQGGPGCSSLFGTFYLNGPFQLQPDMKLQDNPGKWNRRYGMLFIDQPIGTGFSIAGNQPIPNSELKLASHLYIALQNFYKAHSQYKRRPLYVTGESYAGKYVPSISHYIVQAQAMKDGTAHDLKQFRALPADVEAPVFRFGGLAIGNGFTGKFNHANAVAQTLVQAEVAFNMGLIDSVQRRKAEAIQHQVVELVRNTNWRAARNMSDALLKFITEASVKDNIAAPENLVYEACSKVVDGIMGHDVMKSVANLVPDLLARSHVLLYQGQFDAECGVASNEAWIYQLAWPGHLGFCDAERQFWRDEDYGTMVLGYVKSHMRLTHVVIRNAGHMVPHDRPVVSQKMLEAWIESAEQGLDVIDMRAATKRSNPGRTTAAMEYA
eukprot:gene13690-13812_t